MLEAVELFAHLGVWDTEENNGVLIYVLLADRDVEIVADRGLNKRITAAEWESVCRSMETHFRNGDFEAGSLAGIEGVTALLAESFSRRQQEPQRTPRHTHASLKRRPCSCPIHGTSLAQLGPKIAR